MRGRPWTRFEDAELRRLTAEGLTVLAIAAALGRTESAVSHRTAYLGAARYRRLTADQKARAAELVRAGRSDAAVCRELGRVCPHAVARVRASIGVPVAARSEVNRGAWAVRKANRNPNAPTPAQARALAALADGPRSAAELHRILGASCPKSTRQVLSRLRCKGLAFCEGKNGPGNARWYALDWWLAHHDRLVWGAARRVHAKNRWCDLEEVHSEVRLGVVSCARRFRPKGFKFSTFAILSAERSALAWAARQRCRGVHIPSDKVFGSGHFGVVGSLSGAGADGEPCDIDVPDRAPDTGPHTDPEFWERAVADLPERWAAVVLGIFRDGKNEYQLAREWGISRQRVHDIKVEALERIRERKNLIEYDEKSYGDNEGCG